MSPRRSLPALGTREQFRLPAMVDTMLSNGLRVIAAQAPSVPMVEVRMQMPVGRCTPMDLATLQVLADVVLTSTARLSFEAVDGVLGRAGAKLAAVADPSWLGVVGSVPAAALPAVLAVLADALAQPGYAEVACLRARRRLIEQLAVLRAQPQLLAQQALRRHCYGDDAPPLIPDDEAVAAVTAEHLTALHRTRVQPAGAFLVAVGALDPDRLVAELAGALSTWWPVTEHSGSIGGPVLSRTGMTVVRRPGAVQSQISLVAPGLPHTDPRFPALSLGNCALGGYFSSRMVTRLREEAGLVYRVDASFDRLFDAPLIAVNADTATHATATAFDQLVAELRRAGDDPPSSAEIAAAREFFSGGLLIQVASQSGLAEHLAMTLRYGLEPAWLRTFLERLHGVAPAEVAELMREFYSPSRFGGVILGDLTSGDKLQDFELSR